MKLFLTSLGITAEQLPAFCRLTGKPAGQTHLALIENAADMYAEDKRAWMHANREALAAHGFHLDIIDLRAERDLRQRLAQSDVIWLGGGNTYYLRWILHDTGADEIIKELISKGKVYGGASAGAIVAGPTLKYFETADDPNQAPKQILTGLGLTNTVIIPHWDHPVYGPIVKAINSHLQTAGYTTQTLTDQQACIVTNNAADVL